MLRISFYQILKIHHFFSELKSYFAILKQQKKIHSNKLFNEEQLLILEEWYEHNRNFPYANNIINQELAKKTNLSVNQVKNWINHKRAYLRKHEPFSNCRFTPKNRLILSDFYKNNQDPNTNERKHLVDITGLTERQIKSWFAKKKFKAKQLSTKNQL
jgi:hypothetical protein